MPRSNRDSSVRARFDRRRWRQFALVPPALCLMLAALWAEHALLPDDGLAQGLLMAGALAVVGGALLFSHYNWRCPACDEHLGTDIDPRACKSCGTSLSE